MARLLLLLLFALTSGGSAVRHGTEVAAEVSQVVAEPGGTLEDDDVAMEPDLDFLASADPSPPECLAEAGKWSPGRFLGSGAFGETWLVRREEDGQAFAYKQNMAGRSTNEIENEIEIMKALDNMGCPHVIELEDDAPCGADDRWPIFAGYVMQLMQGDLQGWSAAARPDMRQSCASRVARQIASGLSCLHEAGWIHKDLRPDNIFYKAEDEHGCPDDIAVADFGIAAEIGQSSGSYYSESDEEEYDETLNDWCSYFSMMKLEFGYDPKPAELPNYLPSGSCGGPQRVQGTKELICRSPEGCTLKDFKVN